MLYASQDGVAKEINNKNMLISYISHPLMTFKVIAAIHFEALKLWLKGVKLVKKKINLKNNITFEKKWTLITYQIKLCLTLLNS